MRRVAGPARARLARALASAAGLGLGACRPEGAWVACECTFLTDFDDTSATHVEVCAPSVERADEVARGCAQSAAPAPVERCACAAAPVAASERCAVGDCRAR
jgi:hypothetical protein